MNPEQNPQNTKGASEETEMDSTLSIDEFFKQLEAKERDLHISDELVIEVSESDVGEQDISDFLQMDLSAAPHKPETAVTIFDNHPAQIENNPTLRTEVSNLRNQIARLETERAEFYEASRRRQTDFDNYKNRVERERGETFRNQISNLAMQMLPVVDNLNRAMDSSEHIAEECSQDFRQFFEGIVLVSQQLNEILAEMGVQPIIAVGERFDPHYHEAVATETTDRCPAQTVTAELLRGYRIGDKVVRPSMVRVSVTDATGSSPSLVSLADLNSSRTE
jgi:molecular chaperone GrpE